MLLKRTPLLLAAGCWLGILLLGIVGTTTIPLTASADGIGGDTIPFGGGDTLPNLESYTGDQEPGSNALLILMLTLDLLGMPL